MRKLDGKTERPSSFPHDMAHRHLRTARDPLSSPERTFNNRGGGTLSRQGLWSNTHSYPPRT